MISIIVDNMFVAIICAHFCRLENFQKFHTHSSPPTVEWPGAVIVAYHWLLQGRSLVTPYFVHMSSCVILLIPLTTRVAASTMLFVTLTALMRGEHIDGFKELMDMLSPISSCCFLKKYFKLWLFVLAATQGHI